MGTGLGVGQGVVVVPQVIAAGGGDGLKLMIGQPVAKMSARRSASVEEHIVRIVHLLDLMDGFEAAFVERAVVCHER